MKKLIYTLLFVFLWLNLKAQTTPISPFNKQAITFIQTQLLSDYPILGYEQDVKKWLAAYSFRRYEFDTITEPFHLFKPVVDSFLGAKLTNWTYFRVKPDEKQLRKLENIEHGIGFATSEGKEKALSKIWETLESYGIYGDDDVISIMGDKYNIAKFPLNEGTLIIETPQKTDVSDITIRFKINPQYGTASGLLKEWIYELSPIPSIDEPIKKQ